MKSKLTLLVFLIPLGILHAQMKIKRETSLVSKKAFIKRVSENFNELLLAENSPQQGISATFNDSKSNLKINGLLYTGELGVLSVEADLSASEGFYFFDRENGSEQGKVTFNYFKYLFTVSEFYKQDDFTAASVKLEIIELITQAKNEYTALKGLMREIVGDTLLPSDDSDEVYSELKKITNVYIKGVDGINAYDDLEQREVWLKDYYFKTTKEQKAPKAKEPVIKYNANGELVVVYHDNKNISKILNEYKNKKEYILEKLEEAIIDIELKNSESKWAGDHLFFLGLSPYYERQSFKRFSYDSNKSFSDMFFTEKGDVFGVTISANYTLGKGEGSKNRLKPEFLFFRLLADISRTSNIKSFKSSALGISTPLGNDVNGIPINISNSDNAFIGDTPYEYGTGISFNLEGYYYPFKIPLGVFGRIGYGAEKYNSDSVKDEERFPMRLGLLMNLLNEDKKKPIIVIQAFIDRTDLNLSPNSNDDDLRFGLGIGLPIYFN